MTSLRFLAALLVLLHHLPLALPALAAPLFLAQSGYVGVTFFFVLSGFVLTYGWDSSSRARDFYIRRLARIYPVHLLTALLMVAILADRGVPWTVLPLNLALVQSWSPDSTVYYSFVGAAWSLSCEVFFYACFPLLVALLRRCRAPVAASCALVATATAVGISAEMVWPPAGEYLFHSPIFRLSDFMAGMLLCLAVKTGWRPRLRRRTAGMLCVTAYLAVLAEQAISGFGAERAWLNSIVMVMPFGLLIAVVAGKELDGHASFLASTGPVVLGQWSFALYMVHGVILGALHEAVMGSTGPAAVVIGLAIVVVAVVAAWLIYVLYERPVEAAIRGGWARRSARVPLATMAPLH